MILGLRVRAVLRAWRGSTFLPKINSVSSPSSAARRFELTRVFLIHEHRRLLFVRPSRLVARRTWCAIAATAPVGSGSPAPRRFQHCATCETNKTSRQREISLSRKRGNFRDRPVPVARGYGGSMVSFTELYLCYMNK